MILANTGKYEVMRVELKSALFAVDGIKKSAVKKIRKWTAQWKVLGAVVVVKLVVNVKASQCILDVLENTSQEADELYEDLKCE